MLSSLSTRNINDSFTRCSIRKVITTEKFYENLMKSKCREVKQYSAIAALYENKIVLFKRDCCLIIQQNGDVCIAEETIKNAKN